jgi:2'-5' RNA ligase
VRLFVAINLPDAVRQALWEVTEELRGAPFPIRWVEPESIHLTLKFLGEVAVEREGQISAGVTAAAGGAKAFVLPIAGFGAFPSPRRPRVVWAGCEGVATLELLQHRVEQEMERLGFPVEGRPFRPHLTLGRVKQRASSREFEGFEGALQTLHYAGEAMIKSVDLMMSQLGRRGARYSVRHAAELVEC